MSGGRHFDQDKDSTVYVGNLDERCTDALVWEWMLQAGPVVNVHLPKDRVTQLHQGFGFVEFASEPDANYAIEIMNNIRVWGKPVRVNKASADRRGGGPDGGAAGQGVGAELFVGNLDSLVDEKVLFETFSRFGPLVAPPKVNRDDANLSKGYGFISYASFESSDQAIANMHGQYLMNKEITVQYAYKKDGKGERHGDAAERSLAAQAKKHGVQVNIPAMPASLVMPDAPSAPAAMNTGYANGAAAAGAPPVRAPQPPPGYNYGGNYGGYPQAAYNSMPPPPNFSGPPQSAGGYAAQPNRLYNQSPLQAPPTGAGLPARPPPSMVGYGGPNNVPGIQQNFPSGQSGMPAVAMPPGYPPGMAPGAPPGGFRYPPPGAPNGFPPPLPHQQNQHNPQDQYQ